MQITLSSVVRVQRVKTTKVTPVSVNVVTFWCDTEAVAFVERTKFFGSHHLFEIVLGLT